MKPIEAIKGEGSNKEPVTILEFVPITILSRPDVAAVYVDKNGKITYCSITYSNSMEGVFKVKKAKKGS